MTMPAGRHIARTPKRTASPDAEGPASVSGTRRVKRPKAAASKAALGRGRAGARPERARIAKLENELASLKGVLDVTLNNVEQGILMLDAEHRVRLYNRKFVELLELPKRILTDPLHFKQILEYQWSIGEFAGATQDIVSWIR
jgi:hypothetical protein